MMKNKKAETQSAIEQIAEKLRGSAAPLIISHVRPDGDAIGSIIGLGLVLASAGKKPQLFLEDGLPARFRFLAGSSGVRNSVKETYDLVIALDCADSTRIGNKLDGLKIDINIDHHVTNNYFGEINLVQPEKPATAAILAAYLPEMGFAIDKDAASVFLMGILTDTIGFRTTNVSPETLRLSAYLMEAGADLSALYFQSLVSQSYAASLLWGMALSHLAKDEHFVWTTITLEDRKNAGYTGRDDADLTNILSAIAGYGISILFNEQNGGKVKVSWRSNSEVDVSLIAQEFGGGGHPPAAGAELTGSLEQVQEIVLDRTRQFVLKIPDSKGEI